MFWNPFKKKPAQNDREILPAYDTLICYAIEDDSLCIEINIKDYSDESIDRFARLLAGVSTMSFVSETLVLIKDAMKEKPEKYTVLMEKAADYAQKEVAKLLSENENISSEDDPYVHPADAFK